MLRRFKAIISEKIVRGAGHFREKAIHDYPVTIEMFLFAKEEVEKYREKKKE